MGCSKFSDQNEKAGNKRAKRGKNIRGANKKAGTARLAAPANFKTAVSVKS
jgi:hypothetical protein